MNKRGAAQLVFFGIPVATLIWLYLSLFVIGPEIDKALEDVWDTLGNDVICPEEFTSDNAKICFNAQGDVIADGLLGESVSLRIGGSSDSCSIQAGNYEFEYTGCRLDEFKQVTAYDLVMISSKGEISISGAALSKQITSGLGIVKLTPKGIRWLRKASYLVRFL